MVDKMNTNNLFVGFWEPRFDRALPSAGSVIFKALDNLRAVFFMVFAYGLESFD